MGAAGGKYIRMAPMPTILLQCNRLITKYSSTSSKQSKKKMSSTAPPCSFFARGQCKNGVLCRFSHATSHDSPPVAPTIIDGGNSGLAMCSFFARGQCLQGSSCRFLHEPPSAAADPARLAAAVGAGVSAKSRPTPAKVELPIGSSAYSIDVECVASGVQHHDRVIGQIALVDKDCQPILNIYVVPDVPVVSYLTPLTGLTADLLQERGVPLDEALVKLRANLPANSVLVGQNILKDVEWLGLVEGVDFAAQV